jgi:hypothetical protein
MNKKVLGFSSLFIVALVGISSFLYIDSNSTKVNNSKNTNITNPSASPSPNNSLLDSSKIGKLSLPALTEPLESPTGNASAVYGLEYATKVYKFAVAFETSLNSIPDLLNPKSLPSASVLLPFQNYFINNAGNLWSQDAPKIRLGLDTPSVNKYRQLLLIPLREKNGEIKPPGAGETAFVPEAPYAVKVFPGEVNTYTDSKTQISSVYARFKIIFSYKITTSDGKGYTDNISRNVSFVISPNLIPEYSKDYPFMISDWSASSAQQVG